MIRRNNIARAIASAGVDATQGGKLTAQNEAALTRPPGFEPAVEQLVTEADTPVDDMFSETQLRLLSGSLKETWLGPGERRSFILAANIGVFRSLANLPKTRLTALRDATQNS